MSTFFVLLAFALLVLQSNALLHLQMKAKKPMDASAAARIQSATAQKTGGGVGKGSFAAIAQSTSAVNQAAKQHSSTAAKQQSSKAAKQQKKRHLDQLENKITSLTKTVQRLNNRVKKLEDRADEPAASTFTVSWSVDIDGVVGGPKKYSTKFPVFLPGVGIYEVYLSLQSEGGGGPLGLYLGAQEGKEISSYIGDEYNFPLYIGGTEIELVHPVDRSKSKKRVFPTNSYIPESGGGRGWKEFIASTEELLEFVDPNDESIEIVANVKIHCPDVI